MTEEKVSITNNDEITLCGLFQEPKKTNGTCVVLCHGITANKDEYGVFVDIANELSERGFSTLRFDFTAHGESKGNSEDIELYTLVRDIESSVRFIQKEKRIEHISIVSASFAGAPTLLFAGENPNLFDAIVLWNPRIDFETIMHPITEYGRRNWGPQAFAAAKEKGFHVLHGDSGLFRVGRKLMEDMTHMMPWQMLDRVLSPVLFVHGDQDSFVPYSDSVKYSKMFQLPLTTIEGGEHGFVDDYKHELQATHATINFLEKYRA